MLTAVPLGLDTVLMYAVAAPVSYSRPCLGAEGSPDFSVAHQFVNVQSAPDNLN